MAKIFLREIKTGRLARLQYLGYSLLLELLMFGFGFAVVLAIGAGEAAIGGNIQLAQEQLLAWMTVPFIIVFGVVMVLFLFGWLNITAKRIRDMGLPGWWGVLVILMLEIGVSIVFSEQQSGSLQPLIWVILLLIPSDTFARRQLEVDKR